MILCNQLLACAAPPRAGGHDGMLAELKSAFRFTLSPEFWRAAVALKPELSLTPPSLPTWIEWRLLNEAPAGVLVSHGFGIAVRPVLEGLRIMSFGIRESGMIQFRKDTSLDDKRWIAALVCTAAGAIELMSVPRLVDLVETGPSRTQRRAAAKAGANLLRISEVTIRPGAVITQAEAVATGRHGVALHRVRGFTRRRRGKPETVKPFWRGDPAYGVVVADYRVEPAAR